jgi:hypothetical protein
MRLSKKWTKPAYHTKREDRSRHSERRIAGEACCKNRKGISSGIHLQSSQQGRVCLS